MSGRRAFGSIRKAAADASRSATQAPTAASTPPGAHSSARPTQAPFLAHVEAEISEGTWTSPKEARERDRAQEVAAERAAITFAAWSDRWLASLERLGRTPQTIQTHTYRMRQLVPVFGAKPLGAISVEDVDAWYSASGMRRAGVTRPIYMTLSVCMNAAVKAGLIEAEPVQSARGSEAPARPRARAPGRDPRGGPRRSRRYARTPAHRRPTRGLVPDEAR